MGTCIRLIQKNFEVYKLSKYKKTTGKIKNRIHAEKWSTILFSLCERNIILLVSMGGDSFFTNIN